MFTSKGVFNNSFEMFSAVLLLIIGIHGSSAAMTCSREGFFGQTEFMTCPQKEGSPNEYCCGTKENRYCCDTPFGIDEEVLKEFAEREPKALAQVQPNPVVPKTIEDREGVRSTVDRIKTKLNDTVHSAKDKINPKVGITKVKDKVKDKVKQKAEEKAVKKLDPTGGHIKS
ncbi:uncharacterized protein LOC134767702 [Penaeus indicus]|uniref:uncharacterized protein LOC134767702 n=1 Tax=Penaeus indicus TaxID=29960 RepID=UPI00300D210C